MASGIIYVRKDSHLLVEATSDLKRSVAWHYKAASKGKHPYPELNGDIKVDIMRAIRRKRGEHTKAHQERVKDVEADLLRMFWDAPDLCLNKGLEARGVISRRDPKPRRSKRSIRARQGRAGLNVGVDNAVSKGVEIVCPCGRIIHFGSLTECAQFFGVSQQVMSLWMNTRWPGSPGGRIRSSMTLFASRFSARFVSPVDPSLAWDKTLKASVYRA